MALVITGQTGLSTHARNDQGLTTPKSLSQLQGWVGGRTAHGELKQAALDQVLADAQVGNLGYQPVLVLQQHIRALQVQVYQLPSP